MSLFEIGIIIFMCYIGAYGFLLRICDCVEKYALIKYTAVWGKDRHEKLDKLFKDNRKDS